MRNRLVLLVLVLAGCGGGGGTDIQSTLVFAERSDTEILRLINAALGTDMFLLEAQVNQFGDTFDADPCPAVTVEGNVATVTGGCTTADGMTIDGSAAVTNPLGWDQLEEYDFSSPTVYEAQALTFTFGDQPPQIYDGFVRRTDTLTTWDADITVTQLGVAVRSDLFYRCTNPSNPSCTLSGSGLELIGVGGATASGTVVVDAATGQQMLDFTLQGEDRLIVHRDGTCLGWSIEGTDRGVACP